MTGNQKRRFPTVCDGSWVNEASLCCLKAENGRDGLKIQLKKSTCVKYAALMETFSFVPLA